MKKTKKKIKIVRGEKIIYWMIFFLIVTMPLCTVLTKALLSESNIEVEQMKAKIERQKDVNDSLSMQIDELASLDKIQQVATEKGLSYNNENIKVINE
ncbi:MAG: cell division protein FtsL [Bacilli bacterium]|jgi:cell division protein FtsL|nr:cell division protein FtsL [Bacilli bacterium]